MKVIHIGNQISITVLFIGLLLLAIACGREGEMQHGLSDGLFPERVRVWLPSDPERLHPMLSRSGYATQIESNIFLPLMDHDPESLELVPVLAMDFPVVTEQVERSGKQTNAYLFTIREEAQWSDGRPILATDYLFTVKAALNPYVSSTWRGFLSFFVDVELDLEDEKSLTVYVDSDYMLAGEIAGGFFIYPEHIYDPRRLMRQVSLRELIDYEEDALSEEKENALSAFGELFSAGRYSTEVVEGAGPYSLRQYSSGSVISLDRKEEWWGNSFFRNGPNRIDYLIIADEAVALSALKDGTLDIAGEIPARYFRELKSDPLFAEQFKFYTPPLFQMYYIALNNRHPILSAIEVRQALAYLTDLDFMIDQIMGGFGEPAPGVIHPAKDEFNPSIESIPFDLSIADSLLKAAGWSDMDGDGIRDKVIDGKRIPLRLTMDVSSGETGQQLALLLKEAAERVGIDIQIRTREFRLIREDMRRGDFDMTPLIIRQNLFPTDLFGTWHSSAAAPAGNNMMGYSNPEADDLIQRIRVERDEEKRRDLYFRVQEVIHRDHPVVFLAAPVERVAIRSNLEVISSAKRPGYFEGMAHLRELR
ncbi:MAG: hypothetical protein EA409_01195 [Saprospirales bacterium]|nr:MAG: hypothetical protein EA409_01195 [Saprospirales bacterium]